ncbi:MAG: phosphatidate cytidylyltransferase [Bacteroidota bacterium]
MKELIFRTLTGIVLIILVAGSILLGPVPFLGIIILVYGLSLNELFSVYLHGKVLPRMVMAISAGLLLPLTFGVLQYQWNPLWLIIPAAFWMIGFIWSGFIAVGRLILLWLVLPLTSFFTLGWMSGMNGYDPTFPLSVIALIWVNDTFAYVTGTLLGKHKMTPRLSPGKSWEGFVGGILFTLLGGWAIFRISGTYTMNHWIWFSLIIGCLGLLGDLFESSLKRKKSVKNMGKILPGHGGILDRFDSLLFVAPALLTLILLLKLS